jgi:hypothetical protein
MTTAWVPVFGEAAEADGAIVFQGKPSGDATAAASIIMSNHEFAGGKVSAAVEFAAVDSNSVCEFVLWYDPATRNMLTAGLGGGSNLFAIRFYDETSLAGNKWTIYRSGGNWQALQAERKYLISAVLRGSVVTLSIDGVIVLRANTQRTLTPSQVGLFFLGNAACRVTGFAVTETDGRAFVVSEFGASYDELYQDVIRPACTASNLEVLRADETFGPGLIIADITAAIEDSKLVIAEVTSRNPNVFFEVGYAYAMRKPTILLANHGTNLPFDVSPFRTLFYHNTIGGKAKVERALRAHIAAALQTGANLDNSGAVPPAT